MRVTGETKWVDIPHEPGERLQIKMLNWRQLEHAEEVTAEKAFAQAKAAGGEVLRALREVERPKPAEPDPLAGYDIPTLLTEGLVGWSYGDGQPNPDELDAETARFAAFEIVAYSKPGQAEVKNSLSPFTAT